MGGTACVLTNAGIWRDGALGDKGLSCSRGVGDHFVQLRTCVALLACELDEPRKNVSRSASVPRTKRCSSAPRPLPTSASPRSWCRQPHQRRKRSWPSAQASDSRPTPPLRSRPRSSVRRRSTAAWLTRCVGSAPSAGLTDLHRPALLDPRRHQREQFDSGEPVLDEWLHRYAGQNLRRDTAATWVITDADDLGAAYASIVMTGSDRSAAPETIAQGAPDPVPALLLGRVAVRPPLRERWGRERARGPRRYRRRAKRESSLPGRRCHRA
jgi:hypothetical protein